MRHLQAARGTALSGSGRRLQALALGIGLAGIALDQGTKALALAHLDPAQPVLLLGGLLTLQLIRNPGAA
ncbi:MAG TPA: signal peptidase II, partial [Propionicimonas sp.]|nr:signal peptidase II [Propionicimonas sp.]